MTRCKHPSPWGYRRALVVDGELKYMLFCKCDCGTWLPLGPANDTPATAIEVRAAEIAAGIVNPAMNPAVAYAAKCGYDDRPTPFAWWCGWTGLENTWHAGYLARCIHSHPTGDEHE